MMSRSAPRIAGRVLHALGAVALTVAAVGVIDLADRHARFADLSRHARNSLDAKSVDLLALLEGPVEAIAWVPEDPRLHRGLDEFFLRYRRHKPDFEVSFRDPREDLAAVQARAARLGEISLRYAGREERVKRLTESEVTNALARLLRGADRWIAFLAGNGERRVAREANHDLSIFAGYLEQRGLKLRELTLGTVDAVPDNTAALVLASPRVAYTPGEIDAIERYVAGGGNLLWLTEPDAPAGVAALERSLGFERFPGTLVDPVGLTKFRDPAYAVALGLESHPLAEGFDQTVAFPYAAALVAAPNIGWQARALARTEPEAWTETGPFEGNVGFDADDEVQGALDLALVLTRELDGREQRVVVVGDGDFISNAFVHNLGGRELGRRLVEWLAADDELVDIVVEEVPDVELDLAIWQRVTLFLFFGVALPLGLAANAALHWWRRRHA